MTYICKVNSLDKDGTVTLTHVSNTGKKVLAKHANTAENGMILNRIAKNANQRGWDTGKVLTVLADMKEAEA